MTGDLIDRVRSFLGAGPAQDRQDRRDRQRSRGQLYECRDCGTILIREDDRPCPRCGEDLTHIPNEQDLGMG